MKRLLPFIFLILTVPAPAQPITNTNITRSAHANIYAVVIGISQYAPGNNIPSLQFAHRDAQEFANYLQSKSGGSVPAENIRLLLNADATVAAVLQAMAWLKETCNKDDLVFFYFAGHGDKESQTMFNLGFLLTYNTPRPNYEGNALRIEYLNDIANTLSATNKANVVIITDACHSGDLATGSFHWSGLVGDALRAVKDKEIRIASCTTNQLSAEGKDWGGGRGAFSYYLVNGLKGLADRDHDGTVSKEDIQQFLDSCFSQDRILAENRLKQTPVLTGNEDFELAVVDTAALADAIKQMVMPVPNVTLFSPLPMQPQEYLFNVLLKQPLEELLNFFKLDSLAKKDIPLEVIDQLLNRESNESYRDKLNQLKNILNSDKDKLGSFNEKLVRAIHNRGQDIINLYLKGDAAELERRRYYNVKSNGYDEYPKMFSVAAKLTSPDNELYNVLQVDQHYFAGVAARLKVPTVEDPKPLLAISMAEQQLALKLNDNAANIHNELGILYLQKKDLKSAEGHFFKATQIAPDWAIPWANLCGLYGAAKKTDAAILAGHIADSLQPGMQITAVQLGGTYENAGNFLFAEEYYRMGIDINSRHYYPFERLGFVYTSTTQYAAADSFFYEASLRKAGYHFDGNGFDIAFPTLPPIALPRFLCLLDTSVLNKDDIMAFFYWGMEEYWAKRYANAERIFKKIIAVDKSDPLVFHFLGKVFYDQQKWENAEIMFNFAISYHLDTAAFRLRNDSLLKRSKFAYYHDCFEEFYRRYYYSSNEDHYFIASAYERWGHYDEAETHYRFLMQAFPLEQGSYVKLWTLMEQLGRYDESEKIIQTYGANNDYTKALSILELNDFYKRAMFHYPEESRWPHKLGLLLYEFAPKPAMERYLDTVVYFPLLNREIFIDVEEHNRLAGDPAMLLDGNGKNSGKILLMETMVSSGEMRLPGTGERIKLADYPIATPRKDAIYYLSKAAELIKETETLADINFKIGNVYEWAGSKKMSYPYYANAVDLVPTNAGFRLKMIDVCHRLFKNRKGLENLEYLYKNNQINFPDRMLLAEFDIHAGQFAEAKKLLDSALTIHPYYIPAIEDLNGRLLLLSGQPKEALPYYRAYLTGNENDSMALYTIGRLYAKMGNATEAFKWLEKSMAKGFNYSFVLTYDPAWASYRKLPAWEALNKRFPKKKIYQNANKQGG